MWDFSKLFGAAAPTTAVQDLASWGDPSKTVTRKAGAFLGEDNAGNVVGPEFTDKQKEATSSLASSLGDVLDPGGGGQVSSAAPDMATSVAQAEALADKEAQQRLGAFISGTQAKRRRYV